MLKLLTVAAVLAFVANVTLADDQKKQPAQSGDKTDKKMNLEGTYTIVSGEKDGKPLLKSDFDGSIVVITGTKFLGTDKDKKEFFSATYTLDTNKSPATISMTSSMPGKEKTDAKEISSTGLVKWDKDTVTIVYNLPGGKEPTEFKAGEKQHLFVMKKQVMKER